MTAALDGFAEEGRYVFEPSKLRSDLIRGTFTANQNHTLSDTLSDTERTELTTLRVEGDRFMLYKAQAAAILRWRGHTIVYS
jgi:hypothetical protein